LPRKNKSLYARHKKVGRQALPKELLRVPRIYDLTEEEKICACGCMLTYIKDEKSEQLEIIPAKIYVIEHIRKKYACKQCQASVKLATQPSAPIPRSIAASGLLSHVLVSEFQDHLPLYRQESILRRIGVDIPRMTLSLWVIKCAELFVPLLKLMQDRILTYDVAYSDETTLQVLKEPNKGVQSKKYMWLVCRSSKNKLLRITVIFNARSYRKDGGRPTRVDYQELILNYFKRLLLRARVVSVEAKAEIKFCK
jgi:transposase